MTYAFTLGVILSVGSDPKLMHKAKATATSAMQSLGKMLGHLLEQGLDAALKGITKQFTQSE